jgi:DNA-directed RNA polymerase specialized sigma24 family protein
LGGVAVSRRPNDPLREDTATRDLFAEAFAAAPHLFNPAERAAVVATYFEGRSLVAAGAHLGAPMATVRGRVQSARRGLRWWLARRDAA